MAAGNAPQGQITTFGRTIFRYRLGRIFRTAGIKAATRPKQGAQTVAIQLDPQEQQLAHALLSVLDWHHPPNNFATSLAAPEMAKPSRARTMKSIGTSLCCCVRKTSRTKRLNRLRSTARCNTLRATTTARRGPTLLGNEYSCIPLARVDRPRARTALICAVRRNLCSLEKLNWRLVLKPIGAPGRVPDEHG